MISTLLMVALAVLNAGYYLAKVVGDIRLKRWGWAVAGAALGAVSSLTLALVTQIILRLHYGAPGL